VAAQTPMAEKLKHRKPRRRWLVLLPAFVLLLLPPSIALVADVYLPARNAFEAEGAIPGDTLSLDSSALRLALDEAFWKARTEFS